MLNQRQKVVAELSKQNLAAAIPIQQHQTG
jgi:hypothetical protein